VPLLCLLYQPCVRACGCGIRPRVRDFAQEAEHGTDTVAARAHAGKITHFWAHKRSAAEMDAVYSQLLRQGESRR